MRGKRQIIIWGTDVGYFGGQNAITENNLDLLTLDYLNMPITHSLFPVSLPLVYLRSFPSHFPLLLCLTTGKEDMAFEFRFRSTPHKVICTF